MRAASVLDVGCGTGTLLHRARADGHDGRLCGVDPDRAALKIAQRRSDIEWIAATAAAMSFEREFELAVMTSHVFQFLITDQEVSRSLAAIRRALCDDGCFAFETRNPAARSWQDWNPDNAVDVIDPSGRRLRVWHEVEDVSGDVVTVTETTGDSEGTPWRVDRAKLRFLSVAALQERLAEAGLAIVAQYGGWSREPVAETSPEIVTLTAPTRRRGTQQDRRAASG
jgi:SAM-dependent methyltransferase